MTNCNTSFPGNNHNHNNNNYYNNDDITAAQALGFGVGSILTGYELFFGFLIALIVGAFGESLDIVEEFTKGTTYHLMLQRIYRQLMCMGLISFALAFTTLGGSPFPVDYMNGFNFGDTTLFFTAIYFCLQGIWTMFSSIGLGNAWDRASKITTEELQIDVENSYSSSRVWKRMYYPFSVTRNQVEFRILQSIFSSAYNISTKHTELDFGLFLKMTHEDNLLNIIDFDISKWGLILFLIGLASLKVQFYHSSCEDPVCEAEEEIWIFTCCGGLILFLSILLFYWGRKSEILLIQKSGVANIEDYPVFLMVESQMQAQFEKNAIKTANVKTAIKDLMTEEETSKLEAESKKKRKSLAKFYKSAHLVGTLTHLKSNTAKQLDSQSSLSEIGGTILNDSGGIPAKIEEESENESKTPITIFKQPSPTQPFSLPQSQISLQTQQIPRNLRNSFENNHLINQSSIKSFHSSSNPHLQTHPNNLPFQPSQKNLVNKPLSPHGSLSKRFSTRFSTRGFNGDGFECHDDSMDDPQVSSIVSFFEKLSPTKIFQKRTKIIPTSDDNNGANIAAAANANNNLNVDIDVEAQQNQHIGTHSPLHITVASNNESSPFFENNLNNNNNNNVQVSNGPPSVTKGKNWNKAKQLLRRLSSEEIESERKKVKSKMKTNFRRQKFLDIFLFQNPELYYLMLQLLITTNAFYLALWTTNFAIIANRGDNTTLSIGQIILSVFPALCTLPFISQAIKSSSILKAVTKLNLDVVSSVVEKTDIKIQIVATFRQNLTRYLTEMNDGNSVSKSSINDLYEEYNTINKIEGLTFKEFRDLLDGCGIHITKQKARIIYNEMDINRDRAVNMEEFERFLFPEETLINDQKKRKFFDAQNSKLLGEMNKKAAAKRILAFLDPHLISKM